MAGVDVLFEIRNAFFLGNFQHCITEAQKFKVVQGDRRVVLIAWKGGSLVTG